MEERPQKAHHAKQAGKKAERKKAKTNKNQEKNNPKVGLTNRFLMTLLDSNL
jgi:hypothetical protein